MTQEERQLLLKDLCGRLPYGVVVRCTDSDTDYKCFLTTDILHEIQNGYEYYDYKPYLRPLSSMTAEEEEEYNGLLLDVEYYPGKYFVVPSTSVVDWLNAHHFDYRGLIEKWLALESPEGMYER